MKHPVGTRYSNSKTYDQATDKFIHGWQIFEQCQPDGTLTGRKSFIDNTGTLCGIELAETKRYQAILDSAHDLLDALESCVNNANGNKETGYFDIPVSTINYAKHVIKKSAGISEWKV